MRCPRPRRARKTWGAGVSNIIVARARALGRDQSFPPSNTGPSAKYRRAPGLSARRDRPEAVVDLSTGTFDPHVWSGRALQDFAELAVGGVALMYPALNWRRCSRPSWISARP